MKSTTYALLLSPRSRHLPSCENTGHMCRLLAISVIAGLPANASFPRHGGHGDHQHHGSENDKKN